jgi:hypothetical protein
MWSRRFLCIEVVTDLLQAELAIDGDEVSVDRIQLDPVLPEVWFLRLIALGLEGGFEHGYGDHDDFVQLI